MDSMKGRWEDGKWETGNKERSRSAHGYLCQNRWKKLETTRLEFRQEIQNEPTFK
jgi:hypothetical protein